MIEPKKKPCKGTGIANGYGCGVPTLHRVYGLGKMCGCYPDWLLNSEQGKIKLFKATLKAKQPRIDLEQAIHDKKRLDSLDALKNQVKHICHKFIRLRDKGKDCISCGAKWNEHFQAGHFYKAELYSNLKYNELNINGQCRICNLHKDGNFAEYYHNLPTRIGQDKFKEVLRLAKESKQQDFKWDRGELKKIYNYYKEKIKMLI